MWLDYITGVYGCMSAWVNKCISERVYECIVYGCTATWLHECNYQYIGVSWVHTWPIVRYYGYVSICETCAWIACVYGHTGGWVYGYWVSSLSTCIPMFENGPFLRQDFPSGFSLSISLLSLSLSISLSLSLPLHVCVYLHDTRTCVHSSSQSPQTKDLSGAQSYMGTLSEHVCVCVWESH